MLDKQRTVSSPLVVGSMGSAVVAGLVAGVALAVLRPTPVTDASAGASVAVTGAQGGSPLNTRSTGPASWGPTPASTALAAAPWDVAGLELSRVTAISIGQDGPVRLTVDRLTYYTGDRAKKFWAERPDRTPRNYAIVNQNPRLYTFQIASSAAIFIGPGLGASPTPARSDAPALVRGVQAALAGGEKVYVWLQHDDTDGGWATYVAEHVQD